MAFKRAEWHSGLTYRQTCKNCHTIVTYKDDVLDFRPWFADGFVYCPKCKTPLRHNENLAIDKPETPETMHIEPTPAFRGENAFCVQCGKKFNDGDNFCAGCGKKREQ